VGRDPTALLYTWQCQAVALGDSTAEARATALRSPLYQHASPGEPLVGPPEDV
jgi:hypothetical protein